MKDDLRMWRQELLPDANKSKYTAINENVQKCRQEVPPDADMHDSATPRHIFRSRQLLLGAVVFSLFATVPSFSQASLLAPNWDAWKFLIGEWVGEGSGNPGQSEGGFTFSLDLQNRILERHNYAVYPATKDRPAFRHDDLMVVYQEAGKPTQAIYFDNEGHVIRYTAEFSKDSNSVVFASAPSASEPRYRLTNTKVGDDAIAITFEIAPPGKPDAFQQYIKASARRKKG